MNFTTVLVNVPESGVCCFEIVCHSLCIYHKLTEYHIIHKHSFYWIHINNSNIKLLINYRQSSVVQMDKNHTVNIILFDWHVSSSHASTISYHSLHFFYANILNRSENKKYYKIFDVAVVNKIIFYVIKIIYGQLVVYYIFKNKELLLLQMTMKNEDK